ncbi:uncharacterized protein LOC125954499 [Anopheles darlingi]|uniref:uncharacterized protein LOC125954499 n=1 Tax=Anopheles darlingi TaxID=43151 RepID=UPI002100160E|nr:uncharacterized protein LOC125954499 [Anopheles darlingi]
MANNQQPATVKIEPKEANSENVARETTGPIEVIDLTNEETEFRTFVQTLPRPRLVPVKHSAPGPSSAVSCSTGVIRIYALAVPMDYIRKIKLYQDFTGGELFNKQFKLLMVYGRLTQQRVKDDSTVVYKLDDGTGQVNVMFRKTKRKIIDTLNKLSQCEEILLRREKSANNTEGEYPDSLHASLKAIMAMARANCARQINQPPLGTRCFATGFPFQSFNGDITVFAHSFVADSEGGKSMELFWKSYLLSLYGPIIGNNRIDGYGENSINSFKSWLEAKLASPIDS